jgi:hypothetical protein
MSELRLDENEYIPYLATAQAIVKAERAPDLFIRSLFPDATDEQVAVFYLHDLGTFHAGLVQGVELGGHNLLDDLDNI